MALDLSHANPATTAAAIAPSTKPVLITHAGCAAVHNNPRNKSDELMRAVAEKGGVFGIFDLFFTAPSPRQPNVDDYIAHMTHALDVCGEVMLASAAIRASTRWKCRKKSARAGTRDRAPHRGWRYRAGRRWAVAIYGRAQSSGPRAGDCRRVAGSRDRAACGGESSRRQLCPRVRRDLVTRQRSLWKLRFQRCVTQVAATPDSALYLPIHQAA
ncbi:MAG: membrane dipeptidase [Caulobacteraceae bacterium]|nr:membrane dipeptidase [Caulobacteraceae bacterium]